MVNISSSTCLALGHYIPYCFTFRTPLNFQSYSIHMSSFSPSDLSSYVVYVGRYKLNGWNLHESTYSVSRVVIPSGYSEPHNGKDLALVQLSSPVTWSDYVRPVCLPDSGVLFPGGLLCFVTGWGNVRDNGKAC